MLFLLYSVPIVVILITLFLMIKEAAIPQVLRTILSFAIVTSIINWIIPRLITNYFWITTELPINFLLTLWLVTTLFSLTLFTYFENLFPKSKNISNNFVAILLLIIGAISIFVTNYDLLFYILISAGALMLFGRFLLPRHFSSKAYWLTFLYLVPVSLLVGFIMIKGRFMLSPINADLLPFTLLGVNFELFLMPVVFVMALLTIYLLPWQYLSYPFRKFFSRVRIQKR
jgi:hypothetical protein